MTNLLYIGNNKDFLPRLGKVEDLQMIYAVNYQDAIFICLNLKVHQNIIILFEQGELSNDISSIISFRKKFHQAYIILITDKLSEEERKAYLKSGINDTISSLITKDNFLHKLNLIKKRQELLYANIKKEREKEREKEKQKKFILPLWKRIFDLVFATLNLIVLSPVFILTVILIRLESKGPIIYKAKRVGSNYTIFDFYKFRSMYLDADKRLKEMEDLNQYAQQTDNKNEHELSLDDLSDFKFDDNGALLISDDFIIPEKDINNKNQSNKKSPFVKINNDPRVTKVGKIIRKLSIDELPQLINIIKGDMSLVGNRPLPLYEAEMLTDDDSIDRFLAPAGLTGLWQVEKRGDSGSMSATERKKLDLKYAKEFSLWLDIKILFKTFTAFIQRGEV